MSAIEERVVEMQFDNAAFERNIARTRDSLGRFTKELNMKGAGKGLSDLDAAAKKLSFANLEKGVQVVAGHFRTLSESAVAGFEKVGHGIQTISTKIKAMSTDANKGLSDVDAAAKRTSLKNIENGVQAISDKFKAMSVVGITALATVTQRAVAAGANLIKSFSFAPITAGFHEYETNLNSIQTILANTQAAGTNLKDVNGALNELNHYADQTIYNFSEMAKNIGTFTAAGVDLKTSTAAIKGIANLAALSGSNSEQASGAMYQLSQAISAGRVSLEDWNSVVNAGMGGTVFQRALAQNAEKLGTLSKGAVELKGKMKNVTIEGKSFRESITAKPGEESWLTSKVLTQTLAQFTGDLSAAELKAQGFNKAEIKAIQAQAKMAKEAATQVKTFSQLMDTTKEAIGSGWTQTWQLIFGDFTEAKGLFTGVSNSIGKIVGDSSNARNKMLTEWKKFGGRDALISGLGNAFKALGSVIAPIKNAFREIFPATTGKQLADMTKKFSAFMARLKIGSETADKLKRTFAGVFAVFSIVIDVVKGVVGTIFDLIGVATKGSGGFLDFTAKIGDFLVALRDGIREGGGLVNFFKGLGDILAVPIKLVQKLAGFLGSLFKDTNSKGIEKSVAGISSKLEPLGRLGDVISAAWQKTLTVMKNVGSFFQSLGHSISEGLKSIGIDLSTMFEGFDFKTMFAGLNTGVLAGLFLIVKKFLGTFGGGAGGIFDAISEGIGNLTSSFSAMQNALKAATLLQIALAIGVLAVSLSILAKINPDDLTKAGTAITVLFAQLLGSLAIFQKFIGSAGFFKLPFVMGSLILLASAVLILAQAVKQLSGLNWNELAKGLTGLAVTLGLVVGALKFMPTPKGLISVGLGMVVLAGAIKILASAVMDLSGIGWNELAKGLVGVGALLGALVLFTMFSKVNKGGIAQGAGLILLAAGIKILASAVKDMAKMSWKEIGKGLTVLAGSLELITGALRLIPPTAPQAALGVLGVALSLGLIAKALSVLAKMSWAEIGSSLTVMLGALGIITGALYVIPPTALSASASILITVLALQQIAKVLAAFAKYSWEEIGKAGTLLAGTLGIIAGAMFLMTGALPGAAATIIVAAALAILAPVLLKFSQLSLAEIGKSLLMLAGIFAVFGIAALLLAPVVPLMIALGIAVGILGVGMLAAGAGVFLFATGITALAAAGTAATAAVVGIVSGLIGLIPVLMKQIGLGIVAFAKVIATAGPAITKAIVTVLGALIDAIAKLTPKIISTLLSMLTQMLKALANYVPKMVDAGLKLVTGILRGVANNSDKLSDEATRVVVKFLNGISRNLPKIIDAGVKMVISLVNGVANSIRSNTPAMNAAGRNLGSAIIEGMVSGISSGIGSVTSAAGHIASAAISAAKSILDINSPSKEFIKIGKSINEGFLKGLDGDKGQVIAAMKNLGSQLKAAMTDSAKDVDRLEAKLKKLTSARKRDNDEIRKTRVALAQAKKEHKAEASAYKVVTRSLQDETTALGKLADRQDKINARLSDAQKKLNDLVKTRADFKAQITDQYDNLPDITPETNVASYEKDVQTQIEKTKEFANTLQRLRKLGLNDEAYKQLLGKGIDALPFANQLLAGGKAEVDRINALDKQLAIAAKSLGVQASSQLYDAAVNAAKGLVAGLKAQQKNIEAQMDRIAAGMVKAIKKALGIKSPSTVFASVGKYSAEGVIKGVDEMSHLVEKSTARLGTTAAESLRKSLSNVADMVTNDLGARPVITPVLDLSGIRKDASQIGSLMPSKAISVDSAYAKAQYVASSYADNRAVIDEVSGSNPVTPLTFIQNNNSPKALSTAEIYRQSNNLLSRTKGALNTTP